MEPHTSQRTPGAIQRHLSNLKLISRLLGHELHTQSSAKSITLSRDEVVEIQTTLDLFIEEIGRRQGSVGGGAASTETRMVSSRN